MSTLYFQKKSILPTPIACFSGLPRLGLLLILLGLGYLPSVQAQTRLLGWDMGRVTPAQHPLPLPSTVNDLRVEMSTLSRGRGITPTTPIRAGEYSSFRSWNRQSLPIAINTGAYYQFTVTPVESFQVALSTINFNLRRSADGPTEFEVQYSLDGFNSAGVPIPNSRGNFNNANIAQPSSIDLSGIAALQGVNTTVTFRIYAWQPGDGSANGTLAFFNQPGYNLEVRGTVSSGVPGSQVYIWNRGPGATSGAWTTPTNWTPTRTSPAATDVLIFNRDHSAPSDSTIATNVPSQEIGQLRIDQLTNVTLIPAGNSELTINGIAPTNLGLGIGANASLRFYNEEEDQSLVFTLSPGAQALVRGNLIFGGLGPEGENEEAVSLVNNAPHRLLAYQPGSVTFLTGSQFFAQKIRIDPFGDNDTHGTPNNPALIENVVVFQEGSSYRHWSGPEPFGLAPPAGIVQFMPGSTYLLERAGAPPTFGGRTFGNVIVNLSRLGATQQTITVLSNNALPVSVENLTILHGRLDFPQVSNGPATEPMNIRISGSFFVAAGASFTFNPAAPSTISLVGAGPQSISGTGTFEFGENTIVQLNSPADAPPNTVTLLTPLTLDGDLQLTRGFLVTTTANLLTINSSGSVQGGSVDSFVDGPLAQTVSSTTPVSLNYPLGEVDFAADARKFRPLSLNDLLLANAVPTTFTVTKSETPPAERDLPPTIDRVSDVRHYTVIQTPGTTPVLGGSITISYGPDDGVLDPANLRIATSSGVGTWTVLAPAGDTPGGVGTPSGMITSILPDAPTFGDFVLANATGGNNPLPVELITFSGQKEPQGVLLRWTTASEQNNKGFEVLRSTDGVEWVKAGFVNGHGNSQSVRSYTFTDRGASREAATLYYRLKQVDLDGTFAFSRVVAIQTDLLATPLTLYPNPVADELNLNLGQLSQNTRIRIINLLGQVVFEKDYPSQTSQLVENVSFLPAGTYQLEVSHNQNRTFRKFVKTSR